MNSLASTLWLFVGVSGIICFFVFLFSGEERYLNSSDTKEKLFYIFETLGKALSKCSIYIIETVVIGILLALLTTNPKDFQVVTNSSMDTILQTIFSCILPLFFLIWIIEVLDIIKEKYTSKKVLEDSGENNNKISKTTKYLFGLILSVTIFLLLLLIGINLNTLLLVIATVFYCIVYFNKKGYIAKLGFPSSLLGYLDKGAEQIRKYSVVVRLTLFIAGIVFIFAHFYLIYQLEFSKWVNDIYDFDSIYYPGLCLSIAGIFAWSLLSKQSSNCILFDLFRLYSLLFGIPNSYYIFYEDQSNWGQAIPSVLIILALLIRTLWLKVQQLKKYGMKFLICITIFAGLSIFIMLRCYSTLVK